MNQDRNRAIVERYVKAHPWSTPAQLAELITKDGIVGINYWEVARRLSEIKSIVKGPKTECPIRKTKCSMWYPKKYGKSLSKIAVSQ